MPRYDFTTQRLFVGQDLAVGTRIDLDRGQANYLLNVLRMGNGSPVLLFNGRDGEWRAEIESTGRKSGILHVVEQVRSQTPKGNITYLFAPLKQARLEYMVQKAVEMGCGTLQPVLTQHTQFRKINTEKMQSYALEAAEQCGILALPDIDAPLDLSDALEKYSAMHLIFCDEGESSQNPLVALQSVESDTGQIAVLVGPEGGFSEEERAILRSRDNVTPVPLGPRVLRADTAAVAILALVQAALGDWQD